uniref:Putative secreted protein n=1 Tax=Lutzomyia longipalpis TaxID=7200 RepID=A0A7G3AGR6_LUTLO
MSGSLIPHLTLFIVVIYATDVQDVVAADENLTEITCILTINVFLSVGQLQVHVAVHGHEVSFVLVPPFELHHHCFPGQTVEEGFRVDWHGSRHFFCGFF